MHDRDGLRARLPQLGALRVFETVARHESLVRAAEELHVTHGAVSKQIKGLEAELGEELFLRRNRRVFLTERGRMLAAKLRAIFADLEDTLIDFRSQRTSYPLVVSCEPTLCLKFLIPSLTELLHETGVEVRVLAAGGSIDFRRDHIDLAIRRNDFPIDGAIYSKVICEEAMGPVCDPATATKFERVETHLRLPALHTRTRPDAWATWKRLNYPPVEFSSNVIYEHFYLAIEAAMSGQGVALASIHMVCRDIDAKRLSSLAGFRPDGTHYVVLSARPFESDDRIIRFVQWLSKRMNNNLASASQMTRPPLADSKFQLQGDPN